MIPIDWNSIIHKYSAKDMRRDIQFDVGNIIAYARELSEQNTAMKIELQGAKKTMLAITQTCGSIELPFALIDMITPQDRMAVEDIEREGKLYKRFSYRPPAGVTGS